MKISVLFMLVVLGFSVVCAVVALWLGHPLTVEPCPTRNPLECTHNNWTTVQMMLNGEEPKSWISEQPPPNPMRGFLATTSVISVIIAFAGGISLSWWETKREEMKT